MYQKFTKQQMNKHGVCFMLANYSWAWGLSSNMVDIPSDTLLSKTDFSLFQQVSIVE